MEIKSLNELYDTKNIHYWCNCAGDLNMPGTPLNMSVQVENLPPVIRLLYENVWNEMGNVLRYVVTLMGRPGIAMNYLLDDSYIRELFLSCTGQVEMPVEDDDSIWSHLKVNRTVAGKKMAQILQDNLVQLCVSKTETPEVYFGEGTDPDGDEILVFIPFAERGDLSDYAVDIERYDLEMSDTCEKEFERRFCTSLSKHAEVTVCISADGTIAVYADQPDIHVSVVNAKDGTVDGVSMSGSTQVQGIIDSVAKQYAEGKLTLTRLISSTGR